MKHRPGFLSPPALRGGLAALLLTLPACGADPAEETAYADQADAAAEPGGGSAPTGGSAAPGTAGAFTGTWAQRQVTVANVDVPVVGTTRTPTVSLLLVEATPAEAPGVFDLRLIICGIEIGAETDLARTVVPDAFLASLPIVERRATLEADGAYRVDWLTQVHGARLADPENDALPTSADDPRVFDQDEDGRPGLTVRVTGLVDGEVYVAQRGRDRMLGRFVDDQVDGLVEWTSEQTVLDAEVDLLRMPVPTRPEADPEAHVFGMRRLPAGSTCADVLARRPTLFGEATP